MDIDALENEIRRHFNDIRPLIDKLRPMLPELEQMMRDHSLLRARVDRLEQRVQMAAPESADQSAVGDQKPADQKPADDQKSDKKK